MKGSPSGLTGRFWRLRGNLEPPGPRTADDFLAYSRPDVCKAVIDFRVGPSSLSTETRVRVADPDACRKFRRYWLVIRPFSGLIRILLLRAGQGSRGGTRMKLVSFGDESRVGVLDGEEIAVLDVPTMREYFGRGGADETGERVALAGRLGTDRPEEVLPHGGQLP